MRLRCPAKDDATASWQIDVFWRECVARVGSKIQVLHPHHRREDRDRGEFTGDQEAGLNSFQSESL